MINLCTNANKGKHTHQLEDEVCISVQTNIPMSFWNTLPITASSCRARKKYSYNCGKHNFANRKAFFFWQWQCLESPEQSTASSALSDRVLNIPQVVLNEEACISRSHTERERLNVWWIIHRDYKSQRCQFFQWWERMLRSLIQMTWKTTAAATKCSAIKKDK